MGAVIDSSVLIAAERGKLDLATAVAAHGDEALAIATITAAELLDGVHRATDLHRARREAFVEQLLAEMFVVPFDLIAARVHATLSAELAIQRQPVGAHDLLIAATAISLGFAVATRDERSFPRIPGLAIWRW